MKPDKGPWPVYNVSGTRWTFADEPVFEWVCDRLSGDVINVCSGETHLRHDSDVVRNDIDPQHDADTHMAIVELPDELERQFDTVVYDPPWNEYQAEATYDLPGGVIPQTAEQKDALNALCKPRGKIIGVGYTTHFMPRRLDYKTVDGAVFQPYGRRLPFFAVVEQRINNTISSY